MKRIALAAIAFSFIAVPMAQAQSRHEAPRSHHTQQRYDHKSPKHYDQRQYKQHKKYRWSRGDRVPEWQRKGHVRDYHRHGLKRPGRHQQWVRINNEYLLINAASGIIAAVVGIR